jgi:hypothetical protein
MNAVSFHDDVRQNAGRAGPLVRYADLIALILIVIGVLRILPAMSLYSVTSDEPLHVSAGMELVTQHRYHFQAENPPLPRLVFAWPLWRAGGGMFDPALDASTQMKRLFYASGHYVRDIFLARVGNLLFFIIASLATWWLARRELGRLGGLVAMLLFTTQPVVLGYTSIANLDMASVAGLALALLAFSRWIERPTLLRAVVFGAAYGFAVGMKFANIPYVPAACAGMYVAHLILTPAVRAAWRRPLVQLPAAAIATMVVIWANYLFAVGTFAEYGFLKPPPDTIVGRMLAPLDPSTPLPAPHFFAGVAGIMRIDRAGHLSYLFGEQRMDGWWWYFPIATALKTTLATLFFVFAGFAFTRRKAIFIGCVLAVLGILAAAAPAKLDIGVRYVLPLYVPLTIAAALAAMAMLQHPRKAFRAAAIVLLVWHTGVSLVAHPDYFPYFNELAGRDPSRYLVDSNLDWGQDVLRLQKITADEKMDKLGIHLVGMHDYKALGFPPTHHVDAITPTQGWVAVSEHAYRMGSGEGWWWLRGRPYRRVGASIRLYSIP